MLIVPGDTPFIPPALSQRWLVQKAADKSTVSLPSWPTPMRNELSGLLSGRAPRRVAQFAAAIGTRPVTFPSTRTTRFRTSIRRKTGTCPHDR
jgi:molybdopterin-guanine dinucleotide biosynthesis protein A